LLLHAEVSVLLYRFSAENAIRLNAHQQFNERYEMGDFVKSAFGVFFFQHQSMLDCQRRMQEKHGGNNMETVFGVTALPSDTWIRAQYG
jgi:hypothetical protein